MTKSAKERSGMTKNKPNRPIYLDYQATTPVDPRVLEAMLPYFAEKFGNPHSRSHSYGWEAEEAVEHARGQVASVIGADRKEIIFTSGATESNNLAVKGVARFYKERKTHVVTCVTEHKCVLESCRQLESEGFEVTYVPVQKNGLIRLEDLESAITDKTALVSIMAVNNEIGVIQPIEEIGAVCRRRGVFFHTDAAQAVGKIPLDVNEMNIHLMSISGHKVYGPKGVGALYVRRRPRVRLHPQMSGGGQERGLRSGTVPAPLCVGLGKACEIAEQEMAVESERLGHLRDRMLKGIMEQLPEVYLNGDPEHRIPGNLNLSFAHVEPEDALGLFRLGLRFGVARALVRAEGP
jgi:cysteine desulfurase